MLYVETAPAPDEVVNDLISYHRRHRGARYASSHYTAHETAGQFASVGGAIVEVRALAKFGTKRYPSTGGIVQVGASAVCYGHGCATPKHEEPFTEPVDLDDCDYETGATALPAVQAAREWAQAHAAMCRAMAVTS